MPEPYWGILEKAIDDDELIEAAIERIFQTHNFFPSIEAWGMLKKALDDDQTIAQAIAAAIATHETDPDSHTGEGESLETHKAQEVVDHPVGSVLADKITFTEHYSECNFQSMDGWYVSGEAGIENWGNGYLYVEEGLADLSQIYSAQYWPTDYIDFQKNLLYQAICYLDDAATVKIVLTFGAYVNWTTRAGFGFEIDNGVVKGWWFNTNGLVKTANLGINAEAIHCYRAQYVAAQKKIYFYVDGVLKATITDLNITDESATGLPGFVLLRNGVSDRYLWIKSVSIGRQI